MADAEEAPVEAPPAEEAAPHAEAAEASHAHVEHPAEAAHVPHVFGELPTMAAVEINSYKPLEKTYAMIKPDAVKAGHEEAILQMINDAGFVIIAKAKVHMTREQAGDFYAEHFGKGFFDKLVGFMSSGPVIALVLGRVEAIRSWRQLLGPTNSLVAKEQQPKSIRALYGTDGTFNACHGSDAPESAAREIKFFFPHLIMDPRPTAADAAAYINDKLQPTLVKGLTELCKSKPSASKLESITWLANWLLRNNPNKPHTG